MNEYFEEINGNKYLTLVPTNESKEKIKKYEELGIKIRDSIRSITKNSDEYDEKCMKIKFSSDDEPPLNKTIKIPSMIIVVRAVFHENNKYYSQVFLDECYRQKVSIFYLLFLLITTALLITLKCENILIFDISYNIFTGSKPMPIRFVKVDGFIKTYNCIRYLVIFGYWWYNNITDLISEKSGITDSINHNFASIRMDSYNSLPIEKIMTFEKKKML